MVNLRIGIDIGASKIVVAVYCDDKVEVFLNNEGDRWTKFCVAFDEKERLFGPAAEGQFPVNSQNTIHGRDVKRIIGLRKDGFENKISPIFSPLKINGDCDNVKFSIKYRNTDENLFPEHILMMFLSNIRKELETFYKAEDLEAVITVPSMFNSAQRFAVKNAVIASNIKVLQIINDSTASAITYSIDRHGSGKKTILFFDMGAASTDIAVVSLSGNSVDVKAGGGKLNLGGDNFDLKLMQHFIEQFEKEKNVTLSDDKEKFAQQLARLRVSSEKFKKNLSANSNGNLIIETFYNREPFHLKMTRESFETLCSEFFEKIKDVIKDVIKENKIDEVLITGNGSLIPKVEEIVSQICNVQLSKVLNRDESVAIGAAYYAARDLKKAIFRVRNLKVTEVITSPLAVVLNKNGRITLTRPGEFMPFKKDIIYDEKESFSVDFQQGNYTFGRSQVSKAIDIVCNMDINGLVNWMCQDIKKPKTEKIAINHQNPSAMIKDIQKIEKTFEEHEIEYKKAIEMKNELEKICLSYKRKFNSEEMKELLPKSDVEQVIQICLDTLDWLEDTSNPKINELTMKKEDIKTECEDFIRKSECFKEWHHADQQMTENNYQKANATYKNIIDKFSECLDDKQRINIMIKRVAALMNLTKYKEIVTLLNTLLNKYGKDDNYHRKPELLNLREEAESLVYLKKLYQEATNLANSKIFIDSNSKLVTLLEAVEYKFLISKGYNFEFEIYILQARNHLKLKNYDHVIDCCKKAFNGPDNHCEIWEIRAEAYIGLGNLDEAKTDIESLETVSGINPDRINVLKERLERKQYQQKVDEFNRYAEKGNYKEALDILEQFDIKKFKKKMKLDYYCKQAYLYLKLEKYADGIESCDRALYIDSECNRALEIRAVCYFNTKESDKAIKDCEAALKRSKDRAEKDRFEKIKDAAVKAQGGFVKKISMTIRSWIFGSSKTGTAKIDINFIPDLSHGTSENQGEKMETSDNNS